MTENTQNQPALWKDLLPHKEAGQHKYDHGHALIYGAPALTGATNLAASACARVGTGLVTVLSPQETKGIYRCVMPPHILVRDQGDENDPRITAKLYGPGGITKTPDYSDQTTPHILDADALQNLPSKLSPNFVLTPHQGEFDKAFPDAKGSRIEQAQHMAEKLNCHIVLKGAETIITAPNGKVVTNTHAAPWLATAGSGDVLAGLITGLAAQNMPIFEACCAGTWIHGACALAFGPYLVASDLVDILPQVMRSLAVIE
ncbi:MAG: NAD(P)H-hydrate dehydratase [Micavibrio sp.]|nr:NAD(P)H-hydrate dehydratase [Micavibrio sp.]